jgi:hypothetical protein
VLFRSGDARFWFFIQPGKFFPENFETAQFVEVLAPLVAADSANAGRAVNEPHAAFGLVLVLPALAS